MNAEQFMAAYPLTLKEIMGTPIIFRVHAFSDSNLPMPRLAHLRDLAEFAGFSFSALRTALSRASKDGDIESFVDEMGTVRYRLTKAQESVGRSVIEHATGQSGLTIAVFSFKTDEEKKRSTLRKMLGWFGFRMLTQNVYITGSIDQRHVEQAALQEGLAEHLYLFPVSGDISPSAVKKLISVLEVKKQTRRAIKFLADMEAFIASASNPMDFGRRLFYLAPVHHTFSFTNDIPLHPQLLSHDYPFQELQQSMIRHLESGKQDLMNYYLSFEKNRNKE